MSWRLALNSPPPSAVVTSVYQHTLAHTLVLKALNIYVYSIKKFKLSDIPGLGEYSLQSDFTKMILRLTCYHCTVYNNWVELPGSIRLR